MTLSKKASSINIYMKIINIVRNKGFISILDLASLLKMRVVEIEMYVHKGVNESYLSKIGEDNRAIIMAKYRTL
jgi:hypothetical protein